MAVPPMNYSVAGNAFFAAAYGLLMPFQAYFGIRNRTWGFMFGMIAGLLLEVVGYIARVQMANGQKKFLQYIVCITIAPAFFSAAIYLCLSRIVVIYGEHLSRLRPRTITLTFIFADVLSLSLQAAGGAIAGGDNASKFDQGLHVLQAGLSVHLVAIVLFAIISTDFAFTVFRKKDSWAPRFSKTQTSSRFLGFLVVLGLATTCILIRTTFRVAELSAGFGSEIARNETYFFALEGAMVLLAALSLTVWHPGIGVTRDTWHMANFKMTGKRREKATPGPGDVSLESVESK